MHSIAHFYKVLIQNLRFKMIAKENVKATKEIAVLFFSSILNMCT
jgi:hypothetical protein